MNNVYFDYVSCGVSTVWSGRSRADGLVYVNAADISDCLVVRHDPAAEQLGESFTLAADKYATGFLAVYDCTTYYIASGAPSIQNVGVYNETAATNKYSMPTHYENSAAGKGISELSALPELENNRFVALKRITGKKFDPILTDVNDINWKDLFGFDF